MHSRGFFVDEWGEIAQDVDEGQANGNKVEANLFRFSGKVNRMEEKLCRVERKGGWMGNLY